MLGFGRVIGPIGRFLEATPGDSTRFTPDGKELREIDATIRNGPVRLAFWVGVAWALQLTIAGAVLLYADPYRAAIAPRSAVTVALMAGAVVLGSIPFTVPLMSILLNEPGRRVFALAHKAKIPLQREPASLRFKLVYLMTAIGLAGPVWMASTSYSVDGARAALEGRMQSMVVASELARQLDTVNPEDSATLTRIARQASIHGAAVSISGRDGAVLAGERKLTPPLVEWLAQPRDRGADSMASPRDGQIAARAASSSGVLAVVIAPVGEWASSTLALTFVMFFLVVITWAPMCSYFLAVDVVRPLQDIAKTVQQITDVGKLDQVSEIAVTQDDETGILASRFNDLLDMLRDLSGAARALARGDLQIHLEGEGDVATAFRAMIESLGRIVRQIHETSVLLAAAATEIYAASQEQEA
ncbi:MAG: HAMP domain-containing protein, partial [Solirubrobacteraceae bacterium]